MNAGPFMSASAQSSRVNERLLLFTLAAVHFTHIMDYMILMPLGSHLMRVFDISPAQFSRLVAAYSIAAAAAIMPNAAVTPIRPYCRASINRPAPTSKPTKIVIVIEMLSGIMNIMPPTVMAA